MRACIWLLPEAVAAAALDSAIEELAAAYGHARFHAHLTLAVSAPDGANPFDLERISGRSAPLLLERDGVLESERFTRAFALRFALSTQLAALRTHAADGLEEGDALPFDPHVSLFYGVGALLPKDVKDKVLQRFSSPILFDRLALAFAPNHVQSQRDVEAFQLGPVLPLVGGL